MCSALTRIITRSRSKRTSRKDFFSQQVLLGMFMTAHTVCALKRMLLQSLVIVLCSRSLMLADELPTVSDRPPVPTPHFPDAAYAVVWRNWQLVEPDRLAAVLGTTTDKVSELAESMGLPREVSVPREMRERGYITLVRRNWHLLPYDQLLQLLDMTAEDLAFRLREDDFLYPQARRT